MRFKRIKRLIERLLPLSALLTSISPFAYGDAMRPAIHGPSVVGLSPNRPFLFLIPATGAEPLAYSASDLPAGLSVNAETGIITGKVSNEGTFHAHITVTGPKGSAGETLTLICGEHKLAQTPPMGWNAFGIYGDSINDAKVRAAADWLVKSCLAAHGYQYINLGDTWEGIRDDKGDLHPNNRFPDMKSLAGYVHSKGLKFGIYSAATEHTCNGFLGSLGHEAQDAQTFASWGADYLTYDWCPVFIDEKKPPSYQDMQATFSLMGKSLDATDRDIVYAISTFGKYGPAFWAAQTGANLWETTGGLFDDWKVISETGANQVLLSDRGGPGHWNYPGLLMVGRISYRNEHLSVLRPSEQQTQMSMWCLLSAPLFLSSDLAHLDPNAFNHSTTDLLTNDEVLAIDQDPLGRPAIQTLSLYRQHVWMKPLSDGRVAVGFFNLTETPQSMSIAWSDLGLTGSQPVRDVWEHQDLGMYDDSFMTKVAPHSVVLVKVGQPRQDPAAPRL